MKKAILFKFDENEFIRFEFENDWLEIDSPAYELESEQPGKD